MRIYFKHQIIILLIIFSPVFGYAQEGQEYSQILEETFNNPKLNTLEYLEKRAKELSKFPEEKLRKIARKARDVKEEKEKKEIEIIRKKWWVK